MPKYECNLCGKVFKQKIDLDRHSEKKNACIPSDKVKDIQAENKQLKKKINEKQKRDAMKSNLTTMFKTCLNLLRDQEGLTGDKALRTIGNLLILRLSEEQIKKGIIDIDNIDYYDTDVYEEVSIEKYMSYARFSKLRKLHEGDMVYTMDNLWKVILCQHPKFKDLFDKNDSFKITHDSTYKKLLKIIGDFPFETYEADIQGEAYEEIIKDIMTGKILGQFFTPPEIKQFMVDLIDPQVKSNGKIETIFDPAMGTGGFLITVLRHIMKQADDKDIKLNWDQISTSGLGGREKDTDTYKICKANMLISSGHIFETLELGDSIRNPITNKYDIILANPPFGIKGLQYDEIQTINIKKEEYMPIESNSAVPLFLQAMIYMLKIGGRCATVLPNGQDLFNKGKNLTMVREYLVKTCDLKEIIHMPSDIFNNTSIKTCVFYFEKKKNPCDVVTVTTKGKKTTHKFADNHSTKKIKFYEYNIFTKEKRLLVEVDIKKIEANSYSLNYSEYIDTKIESKTSAEDIKVFKLNEICNINYGSRITKSNNIEGDYPVYGSGAETFTTNKFNREGWNILIGRFAVSPSCCRIVNKKLYLNDSGLTIEPMDRNKLLYKFVGYYLYMNQNKIYKCARGTAQKNLDMDMFKNICIPVPPIAIQNKIVEQIDFITSTCKISEQKIEDLQKLNIMIMENQLKYGTNEKHKLVDICEFIKTGKNKPKDNKKGTLYPYYGTSSVTGYTDEYLFDGEYLLTPRNGTIGNVFKVNGRFFPSDHIFVIKLKEGYNIDFIHCVLKSLNLDSLKHGATIPGITKSDLEQSELLIPSVDKQKEIIQIINQNNILIDKLTLDINQSKTLSKSILNIFITCEANTIEDQKKKLYKHNKTDENDHIKTPDTIDTDKEKLAKSQHINDKSYQRQKVPQKKSKK